MFDKLQAVFERERQFTSDASHELRTPASVIIAQCEYALAHARSEEDRNEALEEVLKQARRMSALIGQLLAFARADQGKAKLNEERLNLSELAQRVMEQVAELAEEKNISVTGNITQNIYVNGDETLLIHLIFNLLENGVKYGRQNGNLHVSLHEDDLNVICTVTDDGIGIGQEDIHKIWERFYRAEYSRSSEGFGLGLPMCKYIVQAHGGEIFATSTLEAGSTFRFTIPKKI